MYVEPEPQVLEPWIPDVQLGDPMAQVGPPPLALYPTFPGSSHTLGLAAQPAALDLTAHSNKLGSDQHHWHC